MPDAYEKVASKYKDKIASGALALVVADTLPVQIELMKKGLSAGQVGQRPFEMGYKAMYFLKDIKDGKAPAGRPDLYRPRRLHAEDRRHLRRWRRLSPATRQASNATPGPAPGVFVSGRPPAPPSRRLTRRRVRNIPPFGRSICGRERERVSHAEISIVTAVLLGLSAGAVSAQTQPATTPAAPAPVAVPSVEAGPDITNVNPDAPVAGANSFTQEQARHRLRANGFSDVGELFKDENGVWRGEARKDAGCWPWASTTRAISSRNELRRRLAPPPRRTGRAR